LKDNWLFRLGTFDADLKFCCGFGLPLLFPQLVEKGMIEGFQSSDAFAWHVVEQFLN